MVVITSLLFHFAGEPREIKGKQPTSPLNFAPPLLAQVSGAWGGRERGSLLFTPVYAAEDPSSQHPAEGTSSNCHRDVWLMVMIHWTRHLQTPFESNCVPMTGA